MRVAYDGLWLSDDVTKQEHFESQSPFISMGQKNAFKSMGEKRKAKKQEKDECGVSWFCVRVGWVGLWRSVTKQEYFDIHL